MNDPHATGLPRPAAPGQALPRPVAPLRPAVAPQPKPADDSMAISIIDDAPGASDAMAQFRATIKAQSSEKTYTRQLNKTGVGAIRMKTFHGHLSDEGVQRFDDRVNDWLENHPQVEVKHSTTTIGLWDGKTKEQAIILNIWY